jgi:hypothetical protein
MTPISKPISKNLHGLIDYSYAVIVPFLPEIAGFEKQESATILCRNLGAGALAYSVLTKARWGLLQVLPFKAHLAIDLSVSCLAVVAPWILGFSGKTNARNALLATGVLGLVAVLLTDSKDEADSKQRYLFI